MKTVVVTDEPQHWSFLNALVTIAHTDEYLSDERYQQDNSLRIINLCSSYNYQSIGYYTALLAHARDQNTIPSALTIQDMLNAALTKLMSKDINEEIQRSLKDIKGSEFVLSIYFGKNIAKCHCELAKKFHGMFPLPLFQTHFIKKKQWVLKSITPLSVCDIPAHHVDFMQNASINYLSKKRFHHWRKKQRFYDLAILVDETEKNGPSNKKALDAFIKAGENLGVNVELVDKHISKNISEYDALFIRATTSVNHYTYRLARYAQQEGLVVIDDPQSIVKCTNKIYLAELMSRHNILTPKTIYINKHHKSLPEISFPCVLKKPDSAFSLGVVKINNQKELEQSLKKYFKSSELILIQPFIPTEYDWRIGIIDNKPIFACRYYMAKGHWQIYNWDDAQETEGDFDTLPLEEVPEKVIKTALKVSQLIGNGLYGVDIKSAGDKHYVIEVNDNPNIDFGIEDQIAGEDLYHQIMSVFIERIRRKHGYV